MVMPASTIACAMWSQRTEVEPSLVNIFLKTAMLSCLTAMWTLAGSAGTAAAASTGSASWTLSKPTWSRSSSSSDVRPLALGLVAFSFAGLFEVLPSSPQVFCWASPDLVAFACLEAAAASRVR